MFKSRHAISLFIIALYFVPFLFLSFYGMKAMQPEKAWSFFSFGLFFGIGGSLILFYLMLQFEQNFSLEAEDEEDSFRTPYLEDENNNLDAIISNLNDELETKRKEIQYLSSENFNLKHRLEEIEVKMKTKQQELPLKEKPIAVKEEPIFEPIKESVEKDIGRDKIEEAFEEEEEEVLTPSKIEENLYRSNRVEVTRL